MIVVRLSVWLLGLFLAAAATTASAKTMGEAALRSALQLSQTEACKSAASPLGVVVLPAVDASASLTDQQVVVIRSDFLSAFRMELPFCASLTDAMTAFGTVAFITETESDGKLSEEQQALIQGKLQNAHSIASLRIDRQDGKYLATVNITAMNSGEAISVTSYSLPDHLTTSSCGDNITAEIVGLATLANDFINSTGHIQGLYISAGLYQNTDSSFDYGKYITEQFVAALTAVRNEKIFGTEFFIRRTDNASALEKNEYAVTLRYWPCDTSESARVVVSALSPEGEAVAVTKILSLSALPTGMQYKPKPFTEIDENSKSDREPLPGFMDVSPERVSTGDLLVISAEPPNNCNPFFFDLAPGGRLTPLPLSIFGLTEIRTGFVRYDNNAESRHGVIIQDADERGTHHLGYICQPDGLTTEEIREIFQDLRTTLEDKDSGLIDKAGRSVIYNTSSYDIIQ